MTWDPHAPLIPRLPLFVLATALALASPLSASTPVSREQVLQAIRSFESNASGDLLGSGKESEKDSEVARASNTILKYSLESDDVLVDLGSDAVPWCDVKKGLSEFANSGERGLLLAAYLSGCVKAQLESGKQDPNPYSGWVAMLKIYRAVRLRESVSIPEADALLARQNDGTLEAFAAESSRRSAEKLRKTYGDPGKKDPPADEKSRP